MLNKMLAAFGLLLAAVSAGAADLQLLRQQVLDTERAFARTMADRDHAAFAAYLSDDALFSGPQGPLRGKQAVSEGWKGYYLDKDAPFSWEPKEVEVLESGTLALSSGPVYDPAGKRVSTFTSIWRLEAPGRWRIVFDRGNRYCN